MNLIADLESSLQRIAVWGVATVNGAIAKIHEGLMDVVRNVFSPRAKLAGQFTEGETMLGAKKFCQPNLDRRAKLN
jgi:hypothetical protein